MLQETEYTGNVGGVEGRQMKKRWIAVIGITAAVFLAGCAGENGTADSVHVTEVQDGEELPAVWESTEEPAMELLYLRYGKEQERDIFADSDGGFYHAGIPDGSLYDEEGRPLSGNELESGDYVAVYGDEIMIQDTSPAGIAGVTAMQVTGRAAEEEIEQKLEIVYEMYYSGEGSGTMPTLSLSYSYGQIAEKQAAASPSAWDWTYKDHKEETVHEEQAESKLSLEEDASTLILPLEVDAPGYCFFFDGAGEAPLEVTVTRYPDGQEEAAKELPAQLEGEQFHLTGLENGDIYKITARWDLGEDGKGSTTYLFRIQDEAPYEKAYQRFLESTGGGRAEDGSSPGYNPQEWLDPADFETK